MTTTSYTTAAEREAAIEGRLLRVFAEAIAVAVRRFPNDYDAAKRYAMALADMEDM